MPGGFATSQVYVWDRGDADRFTAVELVSGRNGVPSAAGAEDPAISEDGRIVVFTSIDRSLVDATFPVCVGECPSQIYRFDRDTDANGVFDEPPRGTPLTIVSAVDAGVGSRPRAPDCREPGVLVAVGQHRREPGRVRHRRDEPVADEGGGRR